MIPRMFTYVSQYEDLVLALCFSTWHLVTVFLFIQVKHNVSLIFLL
jgi:hypothetical protein